MRRTGRPSTVAAWRVGPAACVLVAAATASWTATGAATSGDPPDRREVAATYQRDCAVCHGADAQGTGRGPNLRGSGLALIDYTIRTGRMPIAEPDDQVVRSDPAYGPDMIDALVTYVGGLQDGAVADGPEIPSVDPRAGDAATGGTIWRESCASCHAWGGTGGAMLDRAAPNVRPATNQELAEAVRAGPFDMPRFGTAAVTDHELDSLAAFFDEELRHPEDPGGWSIGHIGPVAEGAVALVAGLGALMIVARLIGEGREAAK